jgi:hypothetical protein
LTIAGPELGQFTIKIILERRFGGRTRSRLEHDRATGLQRRTEGDALALACADEASGIGQVHVGGTAGHRFPSNLAIGFVPKLGYMPLWSKMVNDFYAPEVKSGIKEKEGA